MAKSIFDLLGTDESLEETGFTLDLGAAGRFQLLPATDANPAFVKELERALAPVRRQMEAGTLDDSTARTLLAGVYAKTVVKRFDGVIGEDGAEIPFSRAKCAELLANPKLRTLFKMIQREAQDFRNFQRGDVEGDAGN